MLCPVQRPSRCLLPTELPRVAEEEQIDVETDRLPGRMPWELQTRNAGLSVEFLINSIINKRNQPCHVKTRIVTFMWIHYNYPICESMIDNKEKHDDAIATILCIYVPRRPSHSSISLKIHIMVGICGNRDIVSKCVTRNIGSVFRLCVCDHTYLLCGWSHNVVLDVQID